jgi:hypothetical protein
MFCMFNVNVNCIILSKVREGVFKTSYDLKK